MRARHGHSLSPLEEIFFEHEDLTARIHNLHHRPFAVKPVYDDHRPFWHLKAAGLLVVPVNGRSRLHETICSLQIQHAESPCFMNARLSSRRLSLPILLLFARVRPSFLVAAG